MKQPKLDSLLATLIVALLVGCSTSSYKRSPSASGGEDSVEFHSRSLFVNSKMLKFALDGKTEKTRTGLKFGAAENDVASEGITAFFNGMSGLVGAAIAAGVKGSMGIPTLPQSGSHGAPRGPMISRTNAPTADTE